MNPGILVLPGWDDDGLAQYALLAAELASHGWLCRRGDLPDAAWPAARRDTVTRGENLRQTLADYDALAAEAEPGAVAVLGFSYGAYMAALLSAERPIQWLVMRAPAIYPDHDWDVAKAELDKREIARYRHHEKRPTSNRALAACAAFEGDVLLIEDERDEIIPRPVVESYRDAFTRAHSLERAVLPGADHVLSKEASRRAYHALVVKWLMQRLARAAFSSTPAPSSCSSAPRTPRP